MVDPFLGGFQGRPTGRNPFCVSDSFEENPPSASLDFAGEEWLQLHRRLQQDLEPMGRRVLVFDVRQGWPFG